MTDNPTSIRATVTKVEAPEPPRWIVSYCIPPFSMWFAIPTNTPDDVVQSVYKANQHVARVELIDTQPDPQPTDNERPDLSPLVRELVAALKIAKANLSQPVSLQKASTAIGGVVKAVGIALTHARDAGFE